MLHVLADTRLVHPPLYSHHPSLYTPPFCLVVRSPPLSFISSTRAVDTTIRRHRAQLIHPRTLADSAACASDAVCRMVLGSTHRQPIHTRSLAQPHHCRRHDHHPTRLASVSKGSSRAQLTHPPSMAETAAVRPSQSNRMVPSEPGPISLSLSLSLPHPSAPVPSTRASRDSSRLCVDGILSSSRYPSTISR